ncbi:TolB family protein [Paludibaculum fermentans]|uniref:TolB family protein n=1 Tax=Paludibaculum fermentans TaxID=1473598 RepID=UPI003EB79DE1
MIMDSAEELRLRSTSGVEGSRLWRLPLVMVALAGAIALATSFVEGNEKTFLLDVDFYYPIQGVSLSGMPLTVRPEGDCAGRIKVRDVNGTAVLQQEKKQNLQIPAIVARDFSGKMIARFPFAAVDVADLRMSPTGRALVAAGQPGPTAKKCSNGLFFARDGDEWWRLLWCPDRPGAVPDSVSWSPDENEIAFSFENQVFVLSPGGGPPKAVARGHLVRWDPHRDRLAFIDGSEIRVLPLNATAGKEQRLKIPGLLETAAEWSLDGSRLTIAWRSDEQPGDSRVLHDVGLLDVERGTITKPEIRHWGESSRLRWVPLPPSSIGVFEELRNAACSDTAGQ